MQKCEGHPYLQEERTQAGSFIWPPAVFCSIQGAKACDSGPGKQEQTCAYSPAVPKCRSSWCSEVCASVFGWLLFSGERITANTDSSNCYIWYFQRLDLVAVRVVLVDLLFFIVLRGRVDQLNSENLNLICLLHHSEWNYKVYFKIITIIT